MDSPDVRPHGFRAPRRVASAPVTPRPRTTETSPTGDPVETLYIHPNVKIVSFATSGKALLQNTDAAREEAGTLMARSPVERTIAVGPLRIYRAPGSVAFLSCGSALQPILLKSQCWCINEENTVYVLQIRRPNYWRIELQSSWNSDDHIKPEALREVMGMILQFEKTYCPFQRSFSVEVEEPSTPVKKAWTPKHTPNSPGPMLGIVTPELGSPASPNIAKTLFEASMRHSYQHPHPYDMDTQHIKGLGLRSMPSDNTLSTVGSHRSSSPDDLLGVEGSMIHESPVSETTDETCPKLQESLMVPRIVEDMESRFVTDTVPIVSKDPFVDRLVASSSKPVSVTEAAQDDSVEEISEPVHVSLARHVAGAMKPLERVFSAPLFPTHSTPQAPHQVPETILEDGDDTLVESDETEPSDHVSPSPSQDSFHSVESWKSMENSSSDSVGQKSLATSGLSSSTSLEIRQSLVRRRVKRDSQPSESDSPTNRKGHSPLSAQNNKAEKYQGPLGMDILQTAKSLPYVIMAKTCEILLGPPAHLLALMLRIAARIAAGEWRGLILGYSEEGEQIPVQWDISDDEQID